MCTNEIGTTSYEAKVQCEDPMYEIYIVTKATEAKNLKAKLLKI